MKNLLLSSICILLSFSGFAQAQLGYCAPNGNVRILEYASFHGSGTNYTLALSLNNAGTKKVVIVVRDINGNIVGGSNPVCQTLQGNNVQLVSYTSTVPEGQQFITVGVVMGNNPNNCTTAQQAALNPPPTCLTIVPVKLNSFTIKQNAGSNVLYWSTATEINSKLFDIEKRTENQTNFTRIGTVQSMNSATGANYSYTDNSTATGDVYYRLRMVDFDGKIAYSDVRKVSAKSGMNLLVYPNPSYGTINISTSEPNSTLRGVIWNTLGKQMHSFTLISGKPLQINGLIPGTYVLRLTNAATGKTETQKFVVIQ